VTAWCSFLFFPHCTDLSAHCYTCFVVGRRSMHRPSVTIFPLQKNTHAASNDLLHSTDFIICFSFCKCPGISHNEDCACCDETPLLLQNGYGTTSMQEMLMAMMPQSIDHCDVNNAHAIADR